MGSSLRDNLLRGESAIGIHGLGFIGTSCAMAFAHEGVRSICFDINPEKIKLYKQGICDVMGLERWSMMKLKPFIDSGMIVPTNDLKDLEHCPIHFIAVPTEKNGKPYAMYIQNVLETIIQLNEHALIVIESTLSPNWIKELGLNDLNVCIAPRRDWFADPNQSLKNLPRIYYNNLMLYNADYYSILSIVCHNLIKASSMEIACLTKAVENALWFIQIVAVQQLTMGYADKDVNELLRLVATHPRLKLYYPSVKIGGYCVPLGAEYVVQGSSDESHLTLFKESLKYNQQLPPKIAQKINTRFSKARIGIMGITYKNDLKVHTLSAVFDLIAEMPYQRIQVHDPYYTPTEIKDLLKVDSFGYPDALPYQDVLIILTDHKAYYETPLSVLKDKLPPDTYIFDNLGVWEKHKRHFENYHRFGDGSF